MVYLFHGSFWLTVSQVASSLTGFLLAIAFANLLPKDVYGTYRFILSIVAILSAFSLPGINSALTRSVARGYGLSLIDATMMRMRWGVFTSLVALCVGVYYLHAGNVQIALCMTIMAVFVPFFDTFTTASAYVQGLRNFKVDTIASSLIQIGASAGMAIVMYVHPSVIPVLISYFASYCLLRFVYYLYAKRAFPPHGEHDSEVFSYGAHLSFMGILSSVAANMDKILLFHYLGATDVAIYSIVTAAPEQLKNLLRNVGPLATPKLAGASHETLRRELSPFWRKTLLFALAIVGIMVVYIAAAPFLFHFFFPAYEPYVWLSMLFALSLPTVATYLPITLLQAQKRTRELYLFNTIPSVVQIGLYFALIPSFGVVGAVVAWMAGRFFTVIYLVLLIEKTYR